MTHERLRLARDQKGWSVEELAQRAGLRPRAIELIDRGQLAELPAGLYARSSIRSYAVAVGVDPDEALEALTPMLPCAEDPLDGLARRCGHARKAEARAAEPPSLQATAAPAAPIAVAGPSRPLERDAIADIVIAEASTWQRWPAPAAPAPTSGGARHWLRPVAASAIDGAVLAILGGALVWLTARACGTSVPMTLRLAGPAMAAVFALIVALYFVLFGGIGNGTPGVVLMHLDVPPSGRMVLNPREVFGRARRSAFRDGFLVTD